MEDPADLTTRYKFSLGAHKSIHSRTFNIPAALLRVRGQS